MNEAIRIHFPAQVAKAQTLADKGLRVTLDLPEGCIEASALLMVCQGKGVVLDITAVEQLAEHERDKAKSSKIKF